MHYFQTQPMQDDHATTVNSLADTGISSVTTVPSNNITLNFDQFDISSLDMTGIDDFLTGLPYDPFAAGSGPYALEDIDFGFMNDPPTSFDFSHSLPHAHELIDQISPTSAGK